MYDWDTITNSQNPQWVSSGSTIFYPNFVEIGAYVTPSATLQVSGNIYASNSVTTPNLFVSTIGIPLGGQGQSGQVLASTGTGLQWIYQSGGGTSSQWISSMGNTVYYSNNVGIGSTAVPTANLMITGNVYVLSLIHISEPTRPY